MQKKQTQCWKCMDTGLFTSAKGFLLPCTKCGHPQDWKKEVPSISARYIPSHKRWARYSNLFARKAANEDFVGNSA